MGRRSRPERMFDKGIRQWTVLHAGRADRGRPSADGRYGAQQDQGALRSRRGCCQARAALAATGRTYRGKVSLGLQKAANVLSVRLWRQENCASIAATANEFGLSAATVKRYCAGENG
jgi:hypothetical protein